MAISITKYGRLGNNLFQNVVASILAKKFDLKVLDYIDKSEHEKLGVNYYSGNLEYFDRIVVCDDNLLEILKKDRLETGLNVNGFFQIKDFVYNYKEEILSNFNLRYENEENNDLFVHVRVGDVARFNLGIEYYSKAINSLNYGKGYISSDEENHPIVTSLIERYNLTFYQASPPETIIFGKNFRNIVLSKGTFSWWIGMLSKAENILYPNGGVIWNGDIFVFDNWKGISI